MASEAAEAVGWYISHQDGTSAGPLSDAQMRQAIGRGQVKPNDHVWREGMDAWVEARQIPNFEEVRRDLRHETKAFGREMPPHRANSPRPSEQPRPTSAKVSRRKTQTAPPRPSVRAPDDTNSTPGPDAITTESDLRDLLSKIDKEKVRLIGPTDLEKKLTAAAAKIGKFPLGAIVFLGLGLAIMPLLPFFWFIAWRIWAKANK